MNDPIDDQCEVFEFLWPGVLRPTDGCNDRSFVIDHLGNRLDGRSTAVVMKSGYDIDRI